MAMFNSYVSHYQRVGKMGASCTFRKWRNCMCEPHSTLNAWIFLGIVAVTVVFDVLVGDVQSSLKFMTFHDKTEKNHPKKSTLWLFNSSPWKITMPLIGKPSISMGHLYHGELLNNQRVIQKWSNYPQFPDPNFSGLPLLGWLSILGGLNFGGNPPYWILLTYWPIGKNLISYSKKKNFQWWRSSGPRCFSHRKPFAKKGAGSRCKWATNHLWSAQYHLPKFHRWRIYWDLMGVNGR